MDNRGMNDAAQAPAEPAPEAGAAPPLASGSNAGYTEAYGFLRIPADAYPRIPTDTRIFSMVPMDSQGFPRIPADTHGNICVPRRQPRIPMDTRGHPCFPTDARIFSRRLADGFPQIPAVPTDTLFECSLAIATP